MASAAIRRSIGHRPVGNGLEEWPEGPVALNADVAESFSAVVTLIWRTEPSRCCSNSRPHSARFRVDLVPMVLGQPLCWYCPAPRWPRPGDHIACQRASSLGRPRHARSRTRQSRRPVLRAALVDVKPSFSIPRTAPRSTSHARPERHRRGRPAAPASSAVAAQPGDEMRGLARSGRRRCPPRRSERRGLHTSDIRRVPRCISWPVRGVEGDRLLDQSNRPIPVQVGGGKSVPERKTPAAKSIRAARLFLVCDVTFLPPVLFRSISRTAGVGEPFRTTVSA